MDHKAAITKKNIQTTTGNIFKIEEIGKLVGGRRFKRIRLQFATAWISIVHPFMTIDKANVK